MLYIFLSQHLECRNCKKSLQKYKQTRSANRANFVRFFTFQLKVRETDEAEDRPKQRLGRLKEIAESSPNEARRVSTSPLVLA